MRAGSWLLKALAYATAILVSLVCLYPFFWMVVGATNLSADVVVGKATFGDQLFGAAV
jgi:lactose/L-arabinose transport system permease protein